MDTDAYAYNYDPIGNRNSSELNGDSDNYLANVLNQYTNITGGVVSVPTYDLDGNMTFLPSTSGGGAGGEGWHCQWDAENRLITASNLTGGVVARYTYDHQSRRIFKKVANSSVITQHSSFTYDGWNLIQEVSFNLSSGTPSTNLYLWGLDFSGSLQGAGGVGGLLSQTIITPTTASSYFPLADANGNAVTYLDEAGNVQAHYIYDAFGGTVSPSGDMDDDFHFRFSSKYLDDETEFCYYGYRYYDPATGRWFSRDPIGEQGGTMLYGYVGNDAVGRWDLLGMSWWNCKDECSDTDYKEIRGVPQARGRKGSPKSKEAGYDILESLGTAGDVGDAGDLLQCIGTGPAATAQSVTLCLLKKLASVNIDPTDKLKGIDKLFDSNYKKAGGVEIWIYIKYRKCNKKKKCWKWRCTYLDYGKVDDFWHKCSWETIDGMPPGFLNNNGNRIMTQEHVRKLSPRCTTEAINELNRKK